MSQKVHLGPYQLTEQIAKSDIATSWGVNVPTRAGAERMAALKVLNPTITDAPGFADRLIDQVRLAEQLSHVNLAQTWDFGRRDGVFYLLLEFVEGVPLTFMMNEGPVPSSIAVHIALEVASGLSYAHARRDKRGAVLGVVHGDVRPRNVLVSSSGAVKLVDFGVARARKISGEDPVPVAQREVDLFAYADPRHARGEEPTVASDTFSTAALLWSMIAGRRLFEGASYQAVMDKAQNGTIPGLREVAPQVDEALAAIIDRALDIENPDRSLSTASGLRNALTEWQRTNDSAFGRHLVKEHYKALLQEPIATRRTRPLTRREFTPDDACSVIFKPDGKVEDPGHNFNLRGVFHGHDPLSDDLDAEPTMIFSPNTMPPSPPAPPLVDEDDVELLDDDLIETVEDADIEPASARPSALGLAAALAAKKSSIPAAKPGGLAAALAAKKNEAAEKPTGLAAALAAKKSEALPPAAGRPSGIGSKPAGGGLPPRPSAARPAAPKPPAPPAAPPPAPRGNTEVISPIDIGEEDLLSALIHEAPTPRPAEETASAALAALSRFADTGPIAAIEDLQNDPDDEDIRGFVAESTGARGNAHDDDRDEFVSEPTVAGVGFAQRELAPPPAAAIPARAPVEAPARVVPSVIQPRVTREEPSDRDQQDTPTEGVPVVAASPRVESAAPVAAVSTNAGTQVASHHIDKDALAQAVWDDSAYDQDPAAWEDDYDPNEGLVVKKSKLPLMMGLLLAIAVLGAGAFFYIQNSGDRQAAAAVASGLRVTSSPEGARIFINDADTGFLTPRTFTDIAVGESVRIRAELEGYEPSMPVTAQIAAGIIGDISLPLYAIPHVLQIQTNPPGATVYIDGQEAGVTPLTSNPFTSSGALGVNISLQLDGYQPQSVQHTWAPGERNGALTLTLERAPRRR